MSNSVRDSYTDGICPDCLEKIPVEVAEGDECENCGHVFCSPAATEAPSVQFEIRILVTLDGATTTLSAEDHKNAVIAAVISHIGRGLLTEHAPEAVIDGYSVY